jgi:hypothetical protein
MGFGFRSVAVDDSPGDNAWVVWVYAANSDGLAEKVNVTVAGAGICTGQDNYYVAIVGIINRGLDIVKIRRAVIVDGDCPRPARNRKEYTNPDE